MNHKMISMDDVTFERAKKMDNFSAWVRDRVDRLIEEEEEIGWYYCERCNLRYELKVTKAHLFRCPPCAEGFRSPNIIPAHRRYPLPPHGVTE